MNQESRTEIINKKTKELLEHMGFDAEIYERQEEGVVVFNIKARDAQILIGKQGNNLEALQFVVRLLLRKELGEDVFGFALDVDDYKEKRVIYLKELARKAAHHVRDTKKSVSLVPMPAFERRVVHNYLSLYSDIESESVGYEPGRKIIVKLKKVKKSDKDFNFIENS